MEVCEIMSKDVITLDPEMSVGEARDVLLRYRIHGAPVISRTEQLIGMVSFVDLSSRVGKRVRDVMATDPIVADEDMPVEDVAAVMLDQMVRRVPVVSGGRVVGIVSASDIVQLFLNLHEAVREARKAGAVAPGRRGA
jgi:CBS domain-containing protein